VTQQLARVMVLEEGRPAADIADAAVAFCLGGVVAPNERRRGISGRSATAS
jgi:hypothetical protein